MKRRKRSSRPIVFVTDEAKPIHLEKAKQLSETCDCEVVYAWKKGVTHVVTSQKWLSGRRSVDCLLLHADAKSLEVVVPFEWLSSCVEHGEIVKPSEVLSDATFQVAREGSEKLFAGNIFVFSGFPLVLAAPSPASPLPPSDRSPPLRKSDVSRTTRIQMCASDAVLLASLHGAHVIDPMGIPNVLKASEHRGYSPQDLHDRAIASDKLVPRVVVASNDTVTKLGLEIYNTCLQLRPIMMDWFILSIQSQKVADVERFEVF